ncbi:DoxX family membrane protein [Microbacterium sp. X-17]|uniref:DoxX family membrane protein n=1 Tax=Microbacterium sp. X-17 TaxID=3144404 RepID=UPI0031F59019
MTTLRPQAGRRTAAILTALLRVALGALWINEGLLKYHAGFGAADILLVSQSAAQNPRVPDFYKLFSGAVLGQAPAVFGVGVPLVELCLGIALVLGVFTLPAALASVALLCSYWLADQLIAEYPIMLALSAVVATFAPAASRYSVTSVALRRRSVPAALRRWL